MIYQQQILQQLTSMTTTSILLCLVIFLAVLVMAVDVFFRRKNNKDATEHLEEVCENEEVLKQAPRPRGLPLIGHLHHLAGYEVPYQAFSALGRKYGDVVGLQLGTVKCAVINGYKNIREALVTKGHHFDARPNFQRYHQLFSGNKENSLAFCDWSEVHKNRREMLRAFTFPRAFTHKFNTLDKIIFMANRDILRHLDNTLGTPVDFKPLLLQHCANIFTNHFCTKTFPVDDKRFLQMVSDFDDIFYEVNQGYAADFLPFLLPLHRKNLDRMSQLTHNIREFILECIVEDRFKRYEEDEEQQEEPVDYLDSLIRYVKSDESPALSWDTALFALEDILGGHSAVANFLGKLFGFLVKVPQVQARIQEEIDHVAGEKSRHITIGDRNNMPYTEATIFEAIRLIASPIVPRVANQNSSINGFSVEKDTVLFLNNYELSMSPDLWDSPEEFQPERFVRNGRIFKPDFFLPFGGGRRGCMGYKMVQLVSFGILSSIMQHYTVTPVPQEGYKVPIGNLALPKHTYKLQFVKRR